MKIPRKRYITGTLKDTVSKNPKEHCVLNSLFQFNAKTISQLYLIEFKVGAITLFDIISLFQVNYSTNLREQLPVKFLNNFYV